MRPDLHDHFHKQRGVFGPHWGDSEGQPPWMGKRRLLFRRFFGFFLLMAAMFLLLLGGLAYLLARLFGGGGEATLLVWLAGCGLSLALPFGVAVLAARSFRGFADPLARLMAAADALAEGDLSVRVPESGPGELRRLAAAFNHMASELEQADQRRRNLTADVAHELRTPLHVIQGNLEGIQDGVYTADADQIELLLDETRQLARLVDDLRTLSLAEAGQLPLLLEPLDVAELGRDAAVSFSGQAEAAGLELVVEMEESGAPLMISGDAGRLDQALGNLLANAIRHTPAGGKVTLRASRTDAGGMGVRVQVSDTGEGIDAADLPFVFDRFWRGDPARSRGAGAGSGLGLAIARQVIAAHGGRISVESEAGCGATFIVELPGL